jgi:hypothetical protein
VSIANVINHFKEWAGRVPIDDKLAQEVREAIRGVCSAAVVHVYNRQQAETRLAQAAKEAIVAVFQANFPNSLRPFVVRRDWPYAEVWICEDEAIIRYSFSPETDVLMGGIAFEPLRITIQRAPPGLVSRMLTSARKLRETFEAPTGRPEAEEELLLTETVEPPEASEPPRAAKPMPAGMQPKQPVMRR